MKNLLVSGYRAHELNIFGQKHKGIDFIQKAIVSRLIPLVEEGLEWVITPGQYGVDLWACEAAIRLKSTYPNLKVSIMAAYRNPEEKWSEDKKDYYQQLLRGVDYYAAVSAQPYDGVWQLKARDELLFRKTDGLLLVYDEEAEGSPKYMREHALRKQRQGNYKYMCITPDEIEDIANEQYYYDG